MNIYIHETHLRDNPFVGEVGWGNGYVIIPKGHPMYGINYNDIPVTIHGGLTLSEKGETCHFLDLTDKDKKGWVVGFDTAHLNDNSYNCNMEFVLKETENLRGQLIALGEKRNIISAIIKKIKDWKMETIKGTVAEHFDCRTCGKQWDDNRAAR